MRKIVLALFLMPSIALADDAAFDQWLVNEALGRNQAQQVAPSYGLPVQPVLPVPQDRGPNGTGYSIVTTTRPTRNLWDRDMTGSETVQRVVPNNIIGQPMKGVDPLNW
jgi:hypothetical protein